MLNIKVNTDVISKLKPCKDRFDNWKANYVNFDGDLIEFLELNRISDVDKIWVAVRVLPRFLVEVFAIDCATNAASAAAYAAFYAANAAAYAAIDAATYAADAATNAAADAAIINARREQVEVLKYLIKSEEAC